MKKLLLIFLGLFKVVHVVFFLFSKQKNIILLDLKRYYSKSKNSIINLLYALTFISEFRALFYYRIGKARYLIQWLHPVFLNLYFYTLNIGAGLKIQHGFATVIAAKSIGENCWINQQVTIGYTNDKDCPTIGDNVIIYCGAIVLGDIHIGNNSIIGAGAVVTKDIPANCVVVGNPAGIIKRDGKKVNIHL